MSAELLPPLPGDQGWRDQAACRDTNPVLFDFDPETDSESSAEPAKRSCMGCQVRGACLSYALSLPAEDDSVGIYGGLTPAERAGRRSRQIEERPASDRRSWGLATDPAFAQISFDLATGIGVERTAEALGVTGRTLQRSWKRHGLGPLQLGRTLRADVAPYLIERALRQFGWIEHEARLGYLASDPEFAVSSFALAGEFGTVRAAKQLGVNTSLLYRAWDRQALGRPVRPEGWTKQFTADRELVEQAFGLAREQSILAAASAFQVSAPTLRRAFAHHGLGHPHAGLDRAALQRRWSTQAAAEPDHHHRHQRRIARTHRVAQQRSLEPASSCSSPPPTAGFAAQPTTTSTRSPAR
jgi:WhiB family transcriptional regulator, redox-sensing transcriptional regulator